MTGAFESRNEFVKSTISSVIAQTALASDQFENGKRKKATIKMKQRRTFCRKPESLSPSNTHRGKPEPRQPS